MLLADDNVINQKVALRLLQQMGYRPDVATNGVEAVSRRPPDLRHRVMDVMMPEWMIGGHQGIRERQRTGAHPAYKESLIIVAMTASAT
jgi:CheY-like chemotaxis protein